MLSFNSRYGNLKNVGDAKTHSLALCICIQTNERVIAKYK